jgi:hypothetical protein
VLLFVAEHRQAFLDGHLMEILLESLLRSTSAECQISFLQVIYSYAGDEVLKVSHHRPSLSLLRPLFLLLFFPLIIAFSLFSQVKVGIEQGVIPALIKLLLLDQNSFHHSHHSGGGGESPDKKKKENEKEDAEKVEEDFANEDTPKEPEVWLFFFLFSFSFSFPFLFSFSFMCSSPFFLPLLF